MSARFSRRASWDLTENRLAELLRRARAARADLVDLTETNPTRVGLREPARLAALLDDPRASIYEPDPLGRRDAREAIAAYHAAAGGEVDPERVVLTASTSEAYAWIFKLVADPGDRVLVPTPSYPLFEYLASLEGLVVDTYPLVRDEAFRVDTDELARRVTDRTRAVVVVHPNNPTGTLVREADAKRIEEIAAASGAAVLADEVFVDSLHRDRPAAARATFAGRRPCLTFVLSGLSKVCCAPQLKLGWIAVVGPVAEARDAVARLEVIADTYLSVSTPVQLALPRIFDARAAIERELVARLRENLGALDDAIGSLGPGSPLRRVPSDGGWTALLELPRVVTEDEWVLRLAEEAAVLVQPGWFFDLEDEGTIAVSLLAPPGRFARAARSLVETVARAG